VLVVRELQKRLGGRRVLDELTLDCEAGTITAIVGPNGAGKSTLLSILAGVMEPDAGSVDVDGASITRQRTRARARLGYVPEAADPPPHLTVDELIALVVALRRAAPLSPEVREQLGIELLSHQRIDRLSLGERRRACLAAALVGDPALLVLDEPTNGLDEPGIVALASLLEARRAAGCAVVLATHDTRFAERIGARVLQLSAGRLRDPSAT